MRKRLLGVLMLVTTLALAGLAAPALAVEEDEFAPEQVELPSVEEIGTGSETAQDFRQERWEPPTVFDFILFPLLILGGLMALVLLYLYLRWQPEFAEERKSPRRRR